MRILGKWLLVALYTIGIFAVTPFLPNLIRLASSRWQSASVSNFVLFVEILIAFLILIIGIRFLISKKKKPAFLFLASIGGIFLLSYILYQLLPNPYEFTHFPEYAVLSILIIRALDRENGKYVEKGKKAKAAIIKNAYFMSGIITGIIGIADETYQHFLPRRSFLWYDIFLNIIGGIIGLLIFWGMKKQA